MMSWKSCFSMVNQSQIISLGVRRLLESICTETRIKNNDYGKWNFYLPQPNDKEEDVDNKNMCRLISCSLPLKLEASNNKSLDCIHIINKPK